MLFRTHFMFALFCALLFVNDFSGLNKLFFISIVLFASIIPDLDSANSKFGKKLFMLRPIQWLAGHRKIFHSLIFLILITILLWFAPRVVFYGFIVGYVSHLLADCLTIQGVMLFYPFSEKKIKGFIKTGSIAEWLVFLGSFLGVVKIIGRLFFW